MLTVGGQADRSGGEITKARTAEAERSDATFEDNLSSGRWPRCSGEPVSLGLGDARELIRSINFPS